MQIPILKGIYTTPSTHDWRVQYPVNLIPVMKQSGISEGYLRPAFGLTNLATPPGLDRGAINWNNVCYRVSGTKLIRVRQNNSIDVLGDVGGDEDTPVTMTYSFDLLAIASGKNLYYWDGSELNRVTDPDLRQVLTVVWVDGYFMTTDGTFIIVTELNDPYEVDPNKYGSSEVDPDPIVALLKIRNEIYAVNRHTIEIFENVGGTGFPFQRIEGAQMMMGSLGTFCCCVFLDAAAFIGGARNDGISIWLAVNGSVQKLATREVDKILKLYTRQELADSVLEPVSDDDHLWLYVHLPDQTLVYDAKASQEFKTPVWFILSAGLADNEAYPARHHIWCYNKWIVGDPANRHVGILDDSHSLYWGNEHRWLFNTAIIYNESRGAIIHELELVALTGRTDEGTIAVTYTEDGEVYSEPKVLYLDVSGSKRQRIVWFRDGMFYNWRLYRFYGTSATLMSFARLEVRVEGMNH